MAISVVQVSTLGVYGDSLTGTTAFTNPPTAGNAIIYMEAHNDSSEASSSYTVSDGHNAYTQDLNNSHISGLQEVGIGSTLNLPSGLGALTLTFTRSAGTAADSIGGLVAIEVSGLATSAFDAHSVNDATSTTPTTGATGTLAQGSELLIAIVGANSSLTGATVPPTGGPGTFTSLNEITGYFGFYQMAYQIQTTGTTAVNVSWGTISSSNFWVASVATYKGQLASGGKNLLINASGGF